MKKIIFCFGKILFAGVLLCSFCSKGDNISPTPTAKNEVSFLNTKVIFSTLKESKTLLGTSDIYTQGFSIFDLQAKTQNTNATSENDYLAYAEMQAEEWTSTEITNLKASIATAETKINALGLNLYLPEIKIVKSTCLEEGGAVGYTRGNYIVLTATGTTNTGLFLHELFHIYSRANPLKRDELYALLGFLKSNRIEYPDALKDRKITNPDAPFLEHFITLDFKGQQEDAVIILYADSDFTTGSFFQYLTRELLIVEGDAMNKTPKLINGIPDLRIFESSSNFFTQIGTNTSYIIHPEEITAEHFKMLVLGEMVADPSFLAEMKDILD